MLIGTDVGMSRQGRERDGDHADAILAAFTHADDAATAHIHAGAADVVESVEAILRRSAW